MPKLKVCMISGSFEYDSEESLSIFKDHLKKHQLDIETTMIIYESEGDQQSLQVLKSTDVMVIFTRRLNTEGEELERFKSYCNLGNPIVGIRTASHAYQNYLEFDRDVLGGSYAGHFGHGPIAHVQIKKGNADHPILEGIPDFDSYGSLYKNQNNVKDTTILMTASTSEGNREPVAWTRIHNGGRIFYTSLGHQQDFSIDHFLALLTNAILWAGGRK